MLKRLALLCDDCDSTRMRDISARAADGGRQVEWLIDPALFVFADNLDVQLLCWEQFHNPVMKLALWIGREYERFQEGAHYVLEPIRPELVHFNRLYLSGPSRLAADNAIRYFTRGPILALQPDGRLLHVITGTCAGYAVLQGGPEPWEPAGDYCLAAKCHSLHQAEDMIRLAYDDTAVFVETLRFTAAIGITWFNPQDAQEARRDAGDAGIAESGKGRAESDARPGER